MVEPAQGVEGGTEDVGITVLILFEQLPPAHALLDDSYVRGDGFVIAVTEGRVLRYSA